MTDAAPANRTLRADAQRNRDRILYVSKEHFASRGVSASLEDIARAAGVGVGTLYRHFPSREALLAELLAARETHLNIELDDIRVTSPDSGTALHRWLMALTDWASAFDGLPAPLRDAITAQASPLTSTCEGYIDTTDVFLGDAQRDGFARAETRGRDLFLMVLAASWIRSAAMADEASSTATVDLIRTGWSATPRI